MKKRVLGLVFAGVMMLGLTACGDAEEKKYALIENITSEEDQLCSESAWEGILQFSTENGEQAETYKPKGEKRKDYAETIEVAVEAGAEVIVCVGDEMAVPVYEAQNDYRNVNFVLLNADPHKRFSKKANIAENTIALHFDAMTESYLAGYMAVANGARDIGCMGGAENEDSKMAASGFIQGAEAAAKDFGLTEGTVKIRYAFTGEDKLSPAYMSKALSWYTAGCEVIFAPNEQIRCAVIQAAENAQRKVIGIGKSSMEESETMLTASYINYGGAVYQQLLNIKNNTFVGEQSLLCGAKENGAAVVLENSGLDENAVTHYDAIYQKLADGQAKIDVETEMPVTTLVTVETEQAAGVDETVVEPDSVADEDNASEADQTTEADDVAK